MNELEKYSGKSFVFASEFDCAIDDDGVWIQQYNEGYYGLGHIKNENQLITLYEILTGLKWTGDL